MKDLKSYLLGTIATTAILAVAGVTLSQGALAGSEAASMKIKSNIVGGDPDPDAPLEALGAPPIPPDNPQTDAKIALGKQLFFDGRLGGDPVMACSACHSPYAGWGVEAKISFGYPGTTHWRNSQTLINSAYYGKLFWGGSSKSLESQARGAARGAVSANGESDMMEARLAFVPEYRTKFKEVFGDEWPVIGNAWQAIASFERTLVQTDTPFDNYLRGDATALDAAQKRGLTLFTGKAGCMECHNGPLLTDQKYYNIGVPRMDEWADDGLAQITFRFEQYAKGTTEKMYRSIKDDAGLYYVTKEGADKGKFRTPSLRYTAYTGPYMHNGMLETLADVVDFYNQGGGVNEFAANKTPLIKPLGLSDAEKADLVAFLQSFSGDEILMDAPDLPDYAPLPAVASSKEGATHD